MAVDRLQKLRSKSAYYFLGLLYCFIVLLYICVVTPPPIFLLLWHNKLQLMVTYICAVSAVKPQPNKQTNNPDMGLLLVQDVRGQGHTV